VSTVIFVAMRAVRPILYTVKCVRVIGPSCMSACIAICLPVLSLARSLVGCGVEVCRRDQQSAAENWTDKPCVSSINSSHARRDALERIYFIFHDAEKTWSVAIYC